MPDYYVEGEERFGPSMTFLYRAAVNIPSMRKLYSFIVNDLSGHSFKSVLDVGTGPGEVPLMLRSSHRKARIFAVDPSPYMVKSATRRCRGSGILIRQGSSRSIPFKGKFDIIISSLSFHHWAEREKSLRYLSGRLDKRGEIRLYEFERKRRLFGLLTSQHSVTKEELFDAARMSGLRLRDLLCEDGIIRATMTRK